MGAFHTEVDALGSVRLIARLVSSTIVVVETKFGWVGVTSSDNAANE
jgi:hypothetical protein